jgi:hypothetical protein
MAQRASRLRLAPLIVSGCVSALWLCQPVQAQLNQNCVVSVLNRTVSVNPDGTWVLPNIPANFGAVRARATCVQNGVTTFGQSALFTIAPNGAANVPRIQLGSTTPIPNKITLSATNSELTQMGATTQLTAIATYGDGTTQNVSAGSSGTQYRSSNPAIASVSGDGLVAAVSSGNVVIQAINEGTQGIISIQVAISGASNGGLPNTWIIANFCPNFSQGAPCPQLTDPTLGSEDPDHDGLTNLQEFQLGTDPNNPDTDGDGLTDGQEFLTYHTNPLLVSTDGSGIPDGIEVQTNTLGGTLAAKLAASLSSISVKPSNFVLTVNSIQGQASQQLTVTGLLLDKKTTIDLTSTQTGTNYSSSDLTICNFGTPDGNVFAGNGGSCTITVTNNGFTAQAMGTVTGFTPKSLSFLTIPGFTNGVAVNGNTAYIAAGSAGLQVVDVTDRTNPQIIGSLPLPGNANDVQLVSNTAYVAAGSAGLQVVDVTTPAAPKLLGSLSTNGMALDLVVRGTKAYIANGSNLFIADVRNPALISQIGTLALNGTVQGVDVDLQRNLAVVATGTNGLYVVDITNLAAPVVLGQVSTGDARDVAIGGNFAFVADFLNSTVSVDISAPAAPVVRSNITDPNLGGFLQDIVLSGNFALGADVKFFNGIPITDITDPTHLQARAILNFTQRDDNGMGIAADGSYAYLVTEHSSLGKFGSSGDSRLYIGQYLALQDLKGIPPTAAITSPLPGATVILGATLHITVKATDDVAVASVNFLVNGVVAFTATTAPFQFNFTVPSGSSTLTLGATAVDLGANVGKAQNVVINVIPDPLTRVIGRVVDRNGVPVAGASVTFAALATTSATDGTFSLTGVPTAQGNIIILASSVINGQTVRGKSLPTSPVPSGTTNVGDIRLTGGPIALIHCDTVAAIEPALVNTGLISMSDLTEINACGTPPTLATLSAFGAVLVWSNEPFSQPDVLGNVLADYVDQGGGVVLATYSFSTSWHVTGRITTPGYSPFTVDSSPTTPSGVLDLGHSNTSHPIMQGVTATSYFVNLNYTNPPLTAGSVLIAVDTAGNNVVAINPTNRVVGISIFPGFGDMGLLFANAINFIR